MPRGGFSATPDFPRSYDSLLLDTPLKRRLPLGPFKVHFGTAVRRFGTGPSHMARILNVDSGIFGSGRTSEDKGPRGVHARPSTRRATTT